MKTNSTIRVKKLPMAAAVFSAFAPLTAGCGDDAITGSIFVTGSTFAAVTETLNKLGNGLCLNSVDANTNIAGQRMESRLLDYLPLKSFPEVGALAWEPSSFTPGAGNKLSSNRVISVVTSGAAEGKDTGDPGDSLKESKLAMFNLSRAGESRSWTKDDLLKIDSNPATVPFSVFKVVTENNKAWVAQDVESMQTITTTLKDGTRADFIVATQTGYGNTSFIDIIYMPPTAIKGAVRSMGKDRGTVARDAETLQHVGRIEFSLEGVSAEDNRRMLHAIEASFLFPATKEAQDDAYKYGVPYIDMKSQAQLSLVETNNRSVSWVGNVNFISNINDPLGLVENKNVYVGESKLVSFDFAANLYKIIGTGIPPQGTVNKVTAKAKVLGLSPTALPFMSLMINDNVSAATLTGTGIKPENLWTKQQRAVFERLRRQYESAYQRLIGNVDDKELLELLNGLSASERESFRLVGEMLKNMANQATATGNSKIKAAKTVSQLKDTLKEFSTPLLKKLLKAAGYRAGHALGLLIVTDLSYDVRTRSVGFLTLAGVVFSMMDFSLDIVGQTAADYATQAANNTSFKAQILPIISPGFKTDGTEYTESDYTDLKNQMAQPQALLWDPRTTITETRDTTSNEVLVSQSFIATGEAAPNDLVGDRIRGVASDKPILNADNFIDGMAALPLIQGNCRTLRE